MEKSHRIKNVQDCTDTSDCIELSRTSCLYLKPEARLSITVTLPQLKSGQSISNWEVMEKLRAAILPEVFSVIQVTKSTLEFLRFDAEIENRKNLSQVISKIDQKGIKLSGFSDLLKIRATEAKVPFPSRHDWDSFFRDAKHMNEMKPGERPDTVHFQDLPCRWFTHVSDENRNEPSEYVLSKVMSSFGEVRVVDIPMCDPYRKKMSASINGIKTFSFGQDLVFEAYVQFKEYIGFAKCMHALQGKKLVYMENGKAYSANIKVDFDRTKHLSEYSIKKRQAEREKLQAVEREVEEKLRRKQELEEMKLEAERLRLEEEQRLKEERREAKRKEKELRRKFREEKRRAKRMEKEEERILREQEKEEAKFAKKIALEERKLLVAQRKLESIRLLYELFERIKIDRQKKVAQLREAELFEHVDKENTKKLKELKKKELKEKKLQEKMALKERELRDRLVRSYKSKEEDRMELQREKVRKAVQGQVRMQSGLSIKSLSSISSATSESGSDISSETESDSDSSAMPADPKVMIGRLRMDHMEEEEHGDTKWQAQNTQDQQNYYPSYHDAYGFKEGHSYPEEWGYNEGYDRGRGRGRGRWRFPRGPWRGRGFRDRGRGFRDRGRGFRGSWHGNNARYDESKKPLEIRKPKTKWYKRGEDTGGESSRSRSRSRSRSYSRSRRSRSRSRRTRSKSRSRSRRTHSRSKSRSRKSRSRSSSRSRSRSRKSSRSKSRSNRSCSKSRSRSKRSRSRSRSNPAKSHSKSRSRSRRRSRTRSRSKTRSRSRSRSRRRRRSTSEEHSSHSDGRRRDKHRSERHQDTRRKNSDDRIDLENLRESDLELSSDPEGQYDNDYYPDDECDEGNFFSKDFYSRGSGWRGRQNFIRGPRGRWPRNWNRRGRGWGYSSYPDFHEYDKWKHDDNSPGEQYREVYQKYFEGLADREAAEKRKEDNGRNEEERSYPDLKENEEYRPRERETSRRDLPLDRNHPPEEPLRDRSSRIHERLRDSRKMEKNMLDNFSGETEIRKKEPGRNYPARDNKNEKLEARDFELKDIRRGTSRESDWLDHNRRGSLHENVGHTVGHQGKDRYEDKRYSDADRRSYERKHEGGTSYSDKDTGIDDRWKTSVMRADLESLKSDKKEVSVKDRLSFAPVKREPGIVHSKYDPGYDYDRNRAKTHPDHDRVNVRSKVQSGRDHTNERQDIDTSRERRDQRLVEVSASRNLPPRDMREKVNVGHNDRERREGHSESKGRHTFELHDSPISSASDSVSNDGKDSYAKEYDRKRKSKDSEESDGDSDDSDSHYQRHQKKRRKNSKKKKDEKKHKHKKKKKKKDGRRE